VQEVFLHGVFDDAEMSGNLFVGEASQQQRHDLPLAIRTLLRTEGQAVVGCHCAFISPARPTAIGFAPFDERPF
jgi:hypothetical protein